MEMAKPLHRGTWSKQRRESPQRMAGEIDQGTSDQWRSREVVYNSRTQSGVTPLTAPAYDARRLSHGGLPGAVSHPRFTSASCDSGFCVSRISVACHYHPPWQAGSHLRRRSMSRLSARPRPHCTWSIANLLPITWIVRYASKDVPWLTNPQGGHCA